MRKILFLGILGLGSFAAAGPIVAPSSTATVIVGGTLQFTSTDTITCTLVSGSTGTITSGCLYTAPKSFTPHNVIDGVMALPNDHIYNTPVDNLPLDSNSINRIKNIAGGATAYIQIEVSFPHNPMTNATPLTPMTFFATPQNNGQSFPILPAPYTGVESNLYPVDYFAQDRHVLGVNTDTGIFYEMYNYYPPGTNVDCPTCSSQSGVQYTGTSYFLGDTSGDNGGSTDAAGLYIQPLELRYSELKAGVINHALRFTLNNGVHASSFTWPATANAFPGCTPLSNCFSYGMRLRLKSSFDITPYSQTTQVILKALKKYGMFDADGGQAMHIQANTDVFTDTVTYNAIQNEIRFGNIASQYNFEQVDEGSLEVSSATGKVNLANPYVTPDVFAEVVALKVSDGSSTTVRIALQPVTVGTKNTPFPAQAGALSVMAGTPQFQIPFVVKGATTTTATFSMTPTVGTLTAGGLYTAPTGQATVAVSSVTITPDADHSQSISFPLIVFSSDAIRINAGGKSSANNPFPPYDSNGNYGPDAAGHYYWSDPTGNILPCYGKIDGFFPQSSWPSTTTLSTVGMFYTYRTCDKDATYSAMVPNGKYNLSLGFAGDSNNTDLHFLESSIDTQGSIAVSSQTLSVIIGTTAYSPATANIPVTVSNNQFYFTMRNIDNSRGSLINNWSLSPSTSPANSTVFQGNVSIRGNVTIK